MTYLLDTHILLWQLRSPEVFPEKVTRILQDRSARLLISIVVPWEIAIKANTGKLDPAGLLDDFEAKITRASFEMLETTVKQAIRGGKLPLYHRDPFDRLLIAQAIDLNIPIVSNDRIFDAYGVERIWD